MKPDKKTALFCAAVAAITISIILIIIFQ